MRSLNSGRIIAVFIIMLRFLRTLSSFIAQECYSHGSVERSR